MKVLLMALILASSVSAYSSETCNVDSSLDLSSNIVNIELQSEKSLVDLPIQKLSCISLLKDIMNSGKFVAEIEGIAFGVIYSMDLEEAFSSTSELNEIAEKNGLSISVNFVDKKIFVEKKR